MVIDGKAIAQEILDKLKKRVGELVKKQITPHLAVILVGDDASSAAYVRQKELKAQQIGVEISVLRYGREITEKELLEKINKLNNDPEIHGIIIQRPLPPHIDGEKITLATNSQKDIDGFANDSPFDPPVALAVWRCIETAKGSPEDLFDWLQTKNIVILGKGKTAGQPIINFFNKLHLPYLVIDSKTKDRNVLLHNADIIISAVGKERIITPDSLKPGVILIGVGMFQNSEGKLRGDYYEEDIRTIAGAYTPIPGGVGPVNVAMLLANVVDAAEKIAN